MNSINRYFKLVVASLIIAVFSSGCATLIPTPKPLPRASRIGILSALGNKAQYSTYTTNQLHLIPNVNIDKQGSNHIKQYLVRRGYKDISVIKVSKDNPFKDGLRPGFVSVRYFTSPQKAYLRSLAKSKSIETLVLVTKNSFGDNPNFATNEGYGYAYFKIFGLKALKIFLSYDFTIVDLKTLAIKAVNGDGFISSCPQSLWFGDQKNIINKSKLYMRLWLQRVMPVSLQKVLKKTIR